MSLKQNPQPTPAEIATMSAETMRHILTVRTILMGCAQELLDRAEDHDLSKLSPPEDVAFAVLTPKFSSVKYGGPEYKQALKDQRPAIQHHYDKNSHHPEHYENGVEDMDLFDLLEMFVDWKAAGLRHKDSSLEKSLKINAERFEMPEALVRLLENTIARIDQIAKTASVAVSYPHHEGD